MFWSLRLRGVYLSSYGISDLQILIILLYTDPLNWILTGPGFSWDVCKWGEMPARWVPEGRIWAHIAVLYLNLPFTFPCPFPTFLPQMAFFSQHGCTANAANTKYNSRAAQLYREKIKTLATQATRRHGTEVMRTCRFKSPNFEGSHIILIYRSL